LIFFGMAETNIDWRLASEHEKLHFRTRDWWESSHISYSFNCTNVPIKKHQHGGTALFSINKSAHRVCGKGVDPSLLGWWCWTRYKGRNNHSLRVISAYRPNPPGGPYTVYAQHQHFFATQQDPRCPRRAFVEDLCKTIKEFLSSGDHIILLLDGNSSMKSSDLSLALNACTLREVLLDRYGTNGPSTFIRNTTRTTIDGIWATPGIAILAGGYFSYDEFFPSTDHCCL
jgi:hypothetical protein